MAYVHNLDPFAIQITETFGIRWYGLAYLSGFILGYYAIMWMAKRGRTLLREDQVADFITYVAIGVLAGGRLGYCLFYAPDLFTTFDGHFPYWGVLKVNEGGMASHGGILGVLLVSWLYGRRNNIQFWHLQDLTVFGGSIGFFCGRLANFINGELFGRPVAESFRWAVKFPQEMYLWAQNEFHRLGGLAPVVEKLGELRTPDGVVALNVGVWKTWLETYNMDQVARIRVHETIEAIIHAVQASNMAVTEALAPLLTARHPSQLYQAFLEGLLVFILLGILWRKPQKPGVISAWFGTLYCSARIIGEQFRLPDAHIGFQWLGLTRGQWLSIALLAVSIGCLIYFYRRSKDKLGGLLEGDPVR